MRRFERQMLRPVLEAIVSESVAAEGEDNKTGVKCATCCNCIIV
jgi:hypothetical protein